MEEKEIKASECFDAIINKEARKKSVKEFLKKYNQIKLRNGYTNHSFAGNPSLTYYCLNLNGTEMPIPKELIWEYNNMVVENKHIICEKIVNIATEDQVKEENVDS